MANEWQVGLVIIIVAVIILALLFKSKDNSFSGKFFKGIFGIGCILAVLSGIMFIYDDATSDIGDGNDYGYESSSYDSYDEDDVDYYEGEDESSSGAVSFKGRKIVVDYSYGSCTRDCGCTQYAHYPGQVACVYCAENDCTSNKFGHRKNQ